MFRSIRNSLFAALAAFTVLICVAYTGLAVVISYVTEDMLVDRLLQREAASVIAHFRLHGQIRSPDDTLIRVYREAAALPPAVRAEVAAGRQRAEIATDTGQHYHLRTLDLPAASGALRVYLLADVGPLLVVSKLFQEVGGFLTSVALGLLALALLLAYALSRRLVSPLQMLAREVRQVSPDRPLEFAAHRRQDEIGYLARKLGATLTDLHASLAREHAFTRDVSHELRTPLTVMRNALMQAQARPLDASDVTQLQAGLDEIGDTIEVLFALARAEHIAAETIDLRGCFEESLLRLLDQGAWSDGRIQFELPERLPVLGNRPLVALLVNNCLGNAWFHGGPDAGLRVAFANDLLSVTNTMDPARAGATQGFMHGQQLLRRIATAMHWEIAFHAGEHTYRVEIRPLAAG